MNDEPDYIEHLARMSKNATGEEWGPDELLDRLHLFGPLKRTEMLDEFDGHLRTTDASDWQKYTRLCSLRRDLDKVHHTLRKAGR